MHFRTLNLLGQLVQLIDLLQPRVTRPHALHHLPEPRGSLAARSALASALVLVEVR